MTFREDLLEKLKEYKPNVTSSTLRTYISQLCTMLKSIGKECDSMDDLDIFKDKKTADDIIGQISEGKKVSTVKTRLASIVVVLNSLQVDDDIIKIYREKMYELAKEYNNETKENKKSKVQEENWEDLGELKTYLGNMWKRIDDSGMLKQDKLSKKEFMRLQQYVFSYFYIGEDELPPRRSDPATLKIISGGDYNKLSDDDKNSNNYLVVWSRNKKKISYGDYKTSKKYGVQVIDVPKNLNGLLNVYLKFRHMVDDDDNLFYNMNMQPMKPNNTGTMLKAFFKGTGKDMSVNMLRHIYATFHNPVEEQEAEEERAEKMGHSLDTHKDYAKK